MPHTQSVRSHHKRLVLVLLESERFHSILPGLDRKSLILWNVCPFPFPCHLDPLHVDGNLTGRMGPSRLVGLSLDQGIPVLTGVSIIPSSDD